MIKAKYYLLPILIVGLIGCNNAKKEAESSIDQKVDSVLSLMTLHEKIGQMNQVSGHGMVTGPLDTNHAYYKDLIKEGKMGSMLNVVGSEYTQRLQQLAVEETRMGIPLLFAYDVIHGFKTIFPVPLGEAASWDLQAIENSARIAAIEASAAGQHWTFAPMVDITRDPRWGRIMEGAGEDPYYASKVAKARVLGFQGNNLNHNHTILACAKHFVAYGGAIGGRDYNTVDVSERSLHELYYPPFRAAIESGVSTFMTAFNDLNGIPATGHEKIIKDKLRTEWGFEGMIVSDWQSIWEMIPHGFAKDHQEAARKALNAGVDMDMMGYLYLEELEGLVQEGKISEKTIDEAVRRILRAKFALGLFEDPYKYSNPEREKKRLLHEDHLTAAHEMAKKSMVLLKNENALLPLSTDLKSIALIGPMAKNQDDLIGTWSAMGEGKDVISLYDGLINTLHPSAKIFYAKGCDIQGEDKSGFNEALAAARKADIVIAAVGESAMMSGEALCRADISLPGVQEELLLALHRTGKPVIAVLMNGRPLVLTGFHDQIPAILDAWLPGTMGGKAIADVLFGYYNPSGKLPVSFPYAMGQIPVYYNHKNTGRPPKEDERYTSKYLDIPNEPLYPFGYGLSYSDFKLTGVDFQPDSISMNENLKVTIRMKNNGPYDGEQVVQVYLRDMAASVTRPVKELIKFKKVFVPADGEKTIEFSISKEDLGFYGMNMNFITEPGLFRLMVGFNSRDVMEKEFSLTAKE